MYIIDKEMLWQQFSTTINSFDSALRNCPDELWETQLWEDELDQWVAKGFSKFWYLCYHTLFWLDLYLTGAEEGFTPPAPFDLVEMQDNETLPRVYSRDELLSYLELCRNTCQQTIADLTQEQANQTCSFAWGNLPFAELLLYVMRHVQEHAAQLHMFLEQNRR
ncbi:MAG: DinB family protein [Chloroflexi bacterium HGW-Chloroflexi-3]|nr:MAG: DinB family protein [Chloroflexi bacterium HGW-Chloroflexi-3]